MFDKAGKSRKAKSSSACEPRKLEATRLKLKTTKSPTPEPAAEDFNFWPGNLHPRKYQVKSVVHIFDRWEKHQAAYEAIAAGGGKTIVAALVMNLLQEKAPTKAFYVCPPFLTSNTETEFSKWCFDKNLFCIPDSKIARGCKFDKNGRLQVAGPMVEEIENALSLWPGETVLFVDEAHRFKNEKSKRSKALFNAILPRFKRVVWLSGTPLPNSRPIELWPVLRNSAPDVFGKAFFPFGKKYCGGFKNDFGWDFSGFTNRQEFKARLEKSFMLRVKKEEFGLPPLTEGLITIGENVPAELSRIEREILKKHSLEDLVEGKLAKLEGAEALHLSTYLRLLGAYKIKYALPVIEQLLEDTKENLLIFCVHDEALNKLRYGLADWKPIVISADVKTTDRQALVNEFQTNPKRRLVLAKIATAGVGLTMTKATRILLPEFSWVDGDNGQAIDRAHRIGQTNSVLAQYMVLKNSIDAKRMEVLLNKRSKAI